MKFVVIPLFLGICVLGFSYCHYETEVIQPQSNPHWIFKGQELDLELALTDKTREKGLMKHKALKNNEGMLFVYKEPKKLSYWNRNVSFDIDLAFFDSQSKIISLHMLKAMDETNVSAPKLAQYALEMRRGWFDEKNIRVGDSWPALLEEKWPYVE